MKAETIIILGMAAFVVANIFVYIAKKNVEGTLDRVSKVLEGS